MIVRAMTAGALAICLAAAASSAAGIDLPRRGTLGLGLAQTDDGMIIAAVSQNSDSWRSGVRQGDTLAAINGVEISDFLDVQAATHQLSYRRPAIVGIVRQGERLSMEVSPAIMPTASMAGARVEYGFVITPSGSRIRTVTMFPDSSGLRNDAGLPGVIYLQGLPCQSIDHIGGPDHPRGHLFHRLVEAGFAVTFADKPGIGDSDGEACRDGGFQAEVEAYSSAARQFAQRNDIDSSRVYAVGVSMGGAQAPLVAQAIPLAGIVTWGTGVQPWFDYLISSFRLREWAAPSVEETLADAHFDSFREVLARAILFEHSPDKIRAAIPEDLARFESAYGSLSEFAGRSLLFHREFNATSVRAAWESYSGELLSLHGEFDATASAEDHIWASRILNRNHPGSARFEVLNGVNHSWRNDQEQTPDFSFHERAVEWLSSHASQGPTE